MRESGTGAIPNDENAAPVANVADASPTARLRPPLPAAALHGLAGDVARILGAESGADPAGILLVFLTMLGIAVGPEPHVVFGSDKQSARLFPLIVGDAAAGGKGTILAVVGKLFAEADPEWFSAKNPHWHTEPRGDDRPGCRQSERRLPPAHR